MFRGILRDLESVWKCCQKSVRPVFSPSSGFLCDNRALLSPFFIRESQCWWRGVGYSLLCRTLFKKKKKGWAAALMQSWLVRKTAVLERSDLTRRDSLHPDGLIKCHLAPNFSAFAETGRDFIYSVARPSVESTRWCEFCICLWSETRDTWDRLLVRLVLQQVRWGYTKLYFSWQSFLFLPSCPITHRTGSWPQGPGSGGCACVCVQSYDWLCADGGPWALGDWDMSLPMISFTAKRENKEKMIIMTYQYIQRRVLTKTMT